MVASSLDVKGNKAIKKLLIFSQTGWFSLIRSHMSCKSIHTSSEVGVMHVEAGVRHVEAGVMHVEAGVMHVEAGVIHAYRFIRTFQSSLALLSTRLQYKEISLILPCYLYRE